MQLKQNRVGVRMKNAATRMCLFGFAVFTFTACNDTSSPVVAFASTRATATPMPTFDFDNTAVPTAANLAPTRTATLPPTETFTPTHTFTPSVTPTPSNTFTPSHTPTQTYTLTPTLTPTRWLTNTPIASPTPMTPSNDPNFTPPPTWTPPPADGTIQVVDHYIFSRPVSNSGTNWVDRTYPYGGTAGGRFQTHLGVEFVNPRGTPLFAAGDGVVYFAGQDTTTLFGPIPDYYGTLVVIEHATRTADGQTIYTLYGHMDRITVTQGQPIAAGDEIGTVGATGVAIGPHLHFEVRIGNPNSINSTRNPELWIRPFITFGTLAGRVTDPAGNILYDAAVTIQSSDITRYAYTYHDNTVNSDPAIGENFTIGDLPENYYQVTVSDGNRTRFNEIIYVYPNRTTFIDIQLNP